jgi:hypothetical protein
MGYNFENKLDERGKKGFETWKKMRDYKPAAAYGVLAAAVVLTGADAAAAGLQSIGRAIVNEGGNMCNFAKDVKGKIEEAYDEFKNFSLADKIKTNSWSSEGKEN